MRPSSVAAMSDRSSTYVPSLRRAVAHISNPPSLCGSSNWNPQPKPLNPQHTILIKLVEILLCWCMKLSLRGEYALRALLVLGLYYDKPVVRIQAISDHQNIPKRFLEQILNDLKRRESSRAAVGWPAVTASLNRPRISPSPRSLVIPRRGPRSRELCERTVLREMFLPR